MSGEVRQQALSLVLDVREGQGARMAELLRDRRRAVQQALAGVNTVHFARFVVLPAEDGPGEHPRVRLAFETNFDGELEPHLAELWTVLGPLLDEIFAFCEGFPAGAEPRRIQQFVIRHSLRAQALFAAHPGLSVRMIKNDAALRRAADDYLARRQAEHTLVGSSSLELARSLAAELGARARAQGLYIGRVKRWFPSATGGVLALVLERPLELIASFLLAPFFEIHDWLALRRGPGPDTPELEARRDEIAKHEDRLAQNGLTHLVPIKPGAYRSMVLRLMLRIADGLAKLGSRVGRLGDLSNIHFARWVVLPDGKLLFLSNYDGSWEAYLSDFIGGASKGLTMIWTNTVRYPTTRFLLWGGATDEENFKRWARRYQLPTQIWYSAYPELSVADVLRNARLRELVSSELDEASARLLLGML